MIITLEENMHVTFVFSSAKTILKYLPSRTCKLLQLAKVTCSFTCSSYSRYVYLNGGVTSCRGQRTVTAHRLWRVYRETIWKLAAPFRVIQFLLLPLKCWYHGFESLHIYVFLLQPCDMLIAVQESFQLLTKFLISELVLNGKQPENLALQGIRGNIEQFCTRAIGFLGL